jgi:glutamate carboxypeptidase
MLTSQRRVARAGSCAMTLALSGLLPAVAAPAAPRPDARVVAAVAAVEPGARALLGRLVDIDSGTGDLAGIDAMIALLQPEFEKLGATVDIVPSVPASLGNNLVATLAGTGRGRILLVAHMDTVFLHGTVAQRPYRVVGDHGIGPGAGDDKSGDVSALCALQVLQRIHYRDYARITVILNSNEETGSLGSQELIRLKSRDSDVVLNLERGVPPDGVLVSRKGSAVLRLDITGRAAHSGLEPDKGRNAALEAAHQALALGSLADPAQQTTVNVDIIESGTKTNVIPAQATVIADVRAFSTAEFDRVERQAAELATHTTIPDVTVRTSMERSFPPWPHLPTTDALFARAQRVYAGIGGTLTPVTVGSSSDVSLAAGVGTPAIDGLGIRGGGAHSVDDYADLASIRPRLYLLVRLIMDLGHDPSLR